MTNTTKTNASLTVAGHAKTSVKVGDLPFQVLPVLPVEIFAVQTDTPKVSKTDSQVLKDKEVEELQQDKIVLEEAPKVAETDTLGDVLMAQATPAAAAEPAKDDASDRAAVIPSSATTEAAGGGTLAWGLGGLGGLLAAAAGGGGGAAAGAGAGGGGFSSVLSGLVMMGPVTAGNDLVVTVYDKFGNTLTTGSVNSEGMFSITIQDYTGALLVRVSDANDLTFDYIDETTRQPKDLSVDLRAATYITEPGEYTLAINMLTELAVRELGMAGGKEGSAASVLNLVSGDAVELQEAIITANNNVATAFGLAGEDLVLGTQPISFINLDGSTNAEANTYGKILAGLSGAEDGSTSEAVLASFSDDLEGSVLSGDSLQMLVDGGVKAGVTLSESTAILLEGLQRQIVELQLQITSNDGDIAALIDDSNVGDNDGTPTTASLAGLNAALIALDESTEMDVTALENAIGVADDGEGNATGLFLTIETAIEAAVDALQEQITSNDGDIAALVDRATDLETAVSTLNGSGAGSVVKSIADAIGVQSVSAVMDGETVLTEAVVATGLWAKIEAALSETAKDITSPTITEIQTTAINPDADGAYGVGDVVTVKVSFGEVVLVTGSPYFALTLDTNTAQAIYVGGAGTDQLTFAYTLTANDVAVDGISAAVNALTLNGGSIKDAAGNTANLASDAIVKSTALVVDNGPLTLETSGAAIFGNGLTVDNVVIGVLIGDSGQKLVYLSNLDTGGSYTVPTGTSYVSVDDFFRAIELAIEPTLTEAGTTIKPDFSGLIAFPYVTGFYIVASAETLVSALESENNEGVIPYTSAGYETAQAMIDALGVSVSELNAGGISELGEELSQAFLDSVQGRDNADVALNISGHLTVAQAVQLEAAGFDLTKADFSIRDWADTIQAAMSLPQEKAALQAATQVLANGSELSDLLSFSAFDTQVNLRIEAAEGNDHINAGKGNDEIVGGLGADVINLTYLDNSADTVIYQTIKDGASLPVRTLNFSTNEDDYREGSLLSVTINSVEYSYPTGDYSSDVDGSLNELASVINGGNNTFTAYALAGGVIQLVGDSVNTVIAVASTGNGAPFITNSGLLTVIDVEFSATPGDYVESATFDRQIRVTIAGVVIEANMVAGNKDASVLALANAINAQRLETAVDSEVLTADATTLAAAISAIDTTDDISGSTITLTAANIGTTDGETFTVTAAELDVAGVQQKTQVDFSTDDADYFEGGELRVTIGGYEIAANMVAGSATESVAALMAAIEVARVGVSSDPGYIEGFAGVVQGVETLLGNEVELAGSQSWTNDYKTMVYTFNDDVASLKTLVVTHSATEYFQARKDQETLFDEYTLPTYEFTDIATFAAAVEAELASGNYGLTFAYDAGARTFSFSTGYGFTSGLGLININRQSSFPTLIITAATEAEDPLTVTGAELDFFGALQKATTTFSGDNANYYEDGTLSITITPVDSASGPITITVPMVLGDLNAEESVAALQAEINEILINSQHADHAALSAVISGVSLDGTALTFTAATPAVEQFTLSDAELSYAGIQQQATASFSNIDGDYYEGGQISLTVNGAVISVDMEAGSAANSLAALTAAITAASADAVTTQVVLTREGGFALDDVFEASELAVSTGGTGTSRYNPGSGLTIESLINTISNSDPSLYAYLNDAGALVIATRVHKYDESPAPLTLTVTGDLNMQTGDSVTNINVTANGSLAGPLFGEIALAESVGSTITLTAANPVDGTGEISITEQSTTIEAIPQVTAIDFGDTTDADFRATDDDGVPGTVSVTIAGQVITANMADTKEGTIANLESAILVARDGKFGPDEAFTLQNVQSGDGSVVETAGVAEPATAATALIDLPDGMTGETVLIGSFSLALTLNGEPIAFSGTVDEGTTLADFLESILEQFPEIASATLSTDGSAQVLFTSSSTGADSEITVEEFNFIAQGDFTDPISEVAAALDTVEVDVDTITLTAKDGGVDPLTVSAVSYSTETSEDGEPQIVDVTFSNGQLDNASTTPKGSVVSVQIAGKTSSVTIWDASIGTDSDVTYVNVTNLTSTRSEVIIAALVAEIESDHTDTSALGTVVQGSIDSGTGEFVSSANTNIVRFTADKNGSFTMGEAVLVSFTLSNNTALNLVAIAETFQEGQYVFSGNTTDAGIVVSDRTKGVDEGMVTITSGAENNDAGLVFDNAALEGENDDPVNQTVTNPASDNNLAGADGGYYDNQGLWVAGALVSGSDTGNVAVDNTLQVGEDPTVLDQTVDTVDEGFTDFEYEGTRSILTKGTGEDLINNFQLDHDLIALEGDLYDSTYSSDDEVQYVLGEDSFSPDFYLDENEFGLVISERSNGLDIDLLSDAGQVTTLLNELFDFTSTDDYDDSNDNQLNTSVFAITSAVDETQTAIWVHTQSFDDDNTVEANELNLLAIVNTLEGNGLYEFSSQNFGYVA